MSSKRSLVIIESPAKARSLKEYLGDEFEVLASNGHVRDLPGNYLGVDEEDGFRPSYTILPEKRKVVAYLKKKARSHSRILLAADPDREGEAICWHLSKILEREGVVFARLRFNAVTRETVLASIRKPSRIDMQLVNAQQARRVMDRLVGYKISAWLQRVLGKGKSAGRVQSVALRMIQDREDEIEDFAPVEYWTMEADFRQGPASFTASLRKFDGSTCCRPGKGPCTSDEAETILQVLLSDDVAWSVTSVSSRRRSVKPPPPFITSTLQQAASNRLSFSPSRTMTIAQQLYEGVRTSTGEHSGLITYMRTDSVRMSPESLRDCREYLSETFGSEMLTDSVRRYRSSKGSQDAHEAIRPVNVRILPDSLSSVLSPPQLSLYRLVWNRFASTQLRDAEVVKTTVTVSGGGAEFEAEGEKTAFRGFTVLDGSMLKVSQELPSLARGEAVLDGIRKEQKFTSPPSRFSEAKLVAEMKKAGIGRPSTYVSTIATLLKRGYVEREKRLLVPTQLGTTTVRLLVSTFPHIFQVEFTARMEDLLDAVARGEETYEGALGHLSVPLESSLEQAKKNTARFKEELQEDTGESCPECGAAVVIRWGRYGRFRACSAYPACRFSGPLEGEEHYPGRTCPSCGARLMVRAGRYGRYLGCENHPGCRHTEPLPAGAACPEDGCSGELVERRTGKGRVFFGCSRYPDCSYAVWDRPVPEPCPRCGFPILVSKKKGVWCPGCRKKIRN